MSGPSANQQFVVAPGASVSAIARKHNVASSLLFRWRKQYAGDAKPGISKKAFVPVVLSAPRPVQASGLIEIELSCGRRIRVEAAIDLDVLKRVVEALDGK